MGKVLAVFSPTGGVGVSTIATHLAYLLAAQMETAIVDMIPDFGSVTDFFAFAPKLSTGKFPLIFGPESNVLTEVALPKRSQLKLFSMPPSAMAQALDWKAFFSSSRKSFGMTILDLPHTFLAPELSIGLAQADEIYVVGEYHWATMQQLKAFFESCDRAIEGKCKFIINRSGWIPPEVLAECRSSLNQEIFAELPYEAPLDGVRELRDHSVFAGGIKRIIKTFEVKDEDNE